MTLHEMLNAVESCLRANQRVMAAEGIRADVTVTYVGRGPRPAFSTGRFANTVAVNLTKASQLDRQSFCSGMAEALATLDQIFEAEDRRKRTRLALDPRSVDLPRAVMVGSPRWTYYRDRILRILDQSGVHPSSGD